VDRQWAHKKTHRLGAATALLAIAAIGTGLSGPGEAIGAPVAGKAAKLQLITDYSLQMSLANESPRAVALCPGKLEPYGGAMSATPSPDREGEGVYPHSYERLGAQSGFHTTPVLYDPSPHETRDYQVTLQVHCVAKFGKVADPHDIAVEIPSGTSVTLVATCPKKSVLIGGGFQRAAFEAEGGVYPTESHAISKTQWETSGTAFGTIENDMVSIAYCMASPKRKALLKEVSASVAIAPQAVGSATTPPCPPGRKILYNGFDTNPKTGTQQGTFFADGTFNADQTFTASAFNGSAAPSTLTAYGYCMKTKVIGGSLRNFTKKAGQLDKNTVTKEDQDGNPNG